LRDLLIQHAGYTGSRVAARLLGDWERSIGKFVKVMPRDYRRALEQEKEKAAAESNGAHDHDRLLPAEARHG
jgi:glutamate synthase (ferredoxin)